MTKILGIKLTDKIDNAVKLQSILTKFNCIIKLRIGINNKQTIFCSDSGIILLEVEEGNSSIDLEKELTDIEGIEIQRMIF